MGRIIPGLLASLLLLCSLPREKTGTFYFSNYSVPPAAHRVWSVREV